MKSCELTLFSVALCKCPLKGTEISSRKRNGRQNANTHFWQEQSSEQPHCGVTWTRGESQSGERGGLQNGRDEHGVEAAWRRLLRSFVAKGKGTSLTRILFYPLPGGGKIPLAVSHFQGILRCMKCSFQPRKSSLD